MSVLFPLVFDPCPTVTLAHSSDHALPVTDSLLWHCRPHFLRVWVWYQRALWLNSTSRANSVIVLSPRASLALPPPPCLLIVISCSVCSLYIISPCLSYYLYSTCNIQQTTSSGCHCPETCLTPDPCHNTFQLQFRCLKQHHGKNRHAYTFHLPSPNFQTTSTLESLSRTPSPRLSSRMQAGSSVSQRRTIGKHGQVFVDTGPF